LLHTFIRNPYFSLLSTAWKYARQEKRRFILIYTLFILANIVVAMNPLFYGWFVTDLQKNGAAVMETAWIYIGGFLGLRLLEWMLHGPARVMERQLAFRVSKNFMEDHYHKVLHLPVDWHQENHSGSTISRLRKSFEALRDFFQQGFVYLYSIGKFLFSFGAMLYFSPLFGAIGVVLGFITVLIIIRFDKPYIKSLKEVHEREHEVSSNLFDSLSNIRTVITLKLEKRIHKGLLEKVGNVFPPFKRNVSINEWKWFTAQMMVGLIYCVSVFGYIFQHWTPGVVFQIGGLIIMIGYVNQFTSVFNDIASQYTQIMRFHTEVQNAKEFENVYAATSGKNLPEPLPPLWNTIDIENLSFTRKETGSAGQAAGLDNIGMRIQKGQRIALIGESGSGKSTLLSLLRGLHAEKDGSMVTVNETQRINFDSISTTVTLFPQEPEIFENSILYNITLGVPFPEEDVMKACEQARFAEVIGKLPNGLQTHIQEKGVNLSGGQKQRLALARGILAAQQSEILLLDEPTSSVDPKTEKMIYSNLISSFGDRAMISSLHRLHLLTHFDYIYMLKDGAIIDEGTLEDLKRYSLVFKEMWEHQQAQISEEANYPQLNVAL
jgi:ATP-binding cassette, subfamily B, bacterial